MFIKLIDAENDIEFTLNSRKIEFYQSFDSAEGCYLETQRRIYKVKQTKEELDQLLAADSIEDYNKFRTKWSALGFNIDTNKLIEDVLP